MLCVVRAQDDFLKPSSKQSRPPSNLVCAPQARLSTCTLLDPPRLLASAVLRTAVPLDMRRPRPSGQSHGKLSPDHTTRTCLGYLVSQRCRVLAILARRDYRFVEPTKVATGYCAREALNRRAGDAVRCLREGLGRVLVWL